LETSISSALTAPGLRRPATLHGCCPVAKRHPHIPAGAQEPSRRLLCKY
jgi:hypothetical protein